MVITMGIVLETLHTADRATHGSEGSRRGRHRRKHTGCPESGTKQYLVRVTGVKVDWLDFVWSEGRDVSVF